MAAHLLDFQISLFRNPTLQHNFFLIFNFSNLQFFLNNVPADEVSIGHALISDSLLIGIENAVKQDLDLCN